MTNQDLTEYSAFFKAISNPMRLKIIFLLEDGERCVCEFETELKIDISVISRHLKELQAVSILSSRKEGKKVIYKLERPCLLEFIKCLTIRGGKC